MNKSLIATAIVFAIGFAGPAMAASKAECDAHWSKMDTKKQGYVMHSDMKENMAKMTKAGRKTAAADRITDKEFIDSCLADVFGKVD